MNDKDKEAFDNWFDKIEIKWDLEEAWKAACEYKENEYSNAKKFSDTEVLLAKLTIENAKLKKFISVLGHDDQVVDDVIKSLEKLEKMEYE